MKTEEPVKDSALLAMALLSLGETLWEAVETYIPFVVGHGFVCLLPLLLLSIVAYKNQVEGTCDEKGV
jgi:hypothetical protein